MLIDIPPDVLRKMSTGRMIRRQGKRKVIRGHKQIRIRDKGSTVTIKNVDLQELFQGVYDAGFLTDFRGDILDANVRASQFFQHSKLKRGPGIGERKLG